jgi:hypothetical protein
MGAIRDQSAEDFMKHWGPVKKPKKTIKPTVLDDKGASTKKAEQK